MKFDYKFFLVLSVILLAVFIALVLTKNGFGIRYTIFGLGIGSGLRSVYEFFKEQKRTAEKE